MSSLTLGRSILGRKRDTHSTEQEIRVTFWHVVMDILSVKMENGCSLHMNSKAGGYTDVLSVVLFQIRLKQIKYDAFMHC